MASITTYLLVSGPAKPEAVPDHDLFDDYEFDRREMQEAGEGQLPALTFSLQHPLEEPVDLAEPVRRFSRDVPDATVVLCTTEERFDQVEHLDVRVFRDGKRGGDFEHGYIFNVGPK